MLRMFLFVLPVFVLAVSGTFAHSQDSPKRGDLSWTFEERLSRLEKRVETLEQKAGTKEGFGVLPNPTPPAAAPLPPLTHLQAAPALYQYPAPTYTTGQWVQSGSVVVTGDGLMYGVGDSGGACAGGSCSSAGYSGRRGLFGRFRR